MTDWTIINRLQDARAFHTIMLEKKAKVERRIAELEGMEGLEKKRTEMQAIMMQIAKNRQEVPELLARTRDLAHRRDEVCSTFMAMKKEVEVHKIPVLRRFHEQIRRKQQERQKVLALQSSSGVSHSNLPPNHLTHLLARPTSCASACGAVQLVWSCDSCLFS